MWIDKNTLPNTIDAEIPLLLLLKQDNSGFCGMPITYHQRIVKGWYVSSKRIFTYDDVFNANEQITHYMLYPSDPES